MWAYHIPSGMVTPTAVNEEGLTKIDSEDAYDWVLAQFLTTTMGVSLADLTGGIQFSYQGEERPLEDIVREIAPRRVFLPLGLTVSLIVSGQAAEILLVYGSLGKH